MRRFIAVLIAVPALALAHNGVEHKTPEDAAAHVEPSPELPFPVEISADFDLIDHNGNPARSVDYAGRPMAIFFGYASCEAICSVALPRLGQALDLVGDDTDLLPLVITVDPTRDTPDAMREGLARWHPRLVGLTGSEEALSKARDAFQVETSLVGEDATGAPIYAHGSFIYLIGRDGKVLTLLPPILSPERMAEIIDSYI